MNAKKIAARAKNIFAHAGQYGHPPVLMLNFGHHRHMPVGARGWVDLLVFAKGVVYLIEVKGDGDYLREYQIDFYQEVKPHLGERIRYVIASDDEPFYKIIEGTCRVIEVDDKWLRVLENENVLEAT